MILLDTDVLIDIALDRLPHSEAAFELLDASKEEVEPASLAWHSISNLYYIVKPTHGDITTRDFIRELTEFVHVAETDTESLRYATQLPMDDFEDAMQVAAARACMPNSSSPETSATTNAHPYQQSHPTTSNIVKAPTTHPLSR